MFVHFIGERCGTFIYFIDRGREKVRSYFSLPLYNILNKKGMNSIEVVEKFILPSAYHQPVFPFLDQALPPASSLVILVESIHEQPILLEAGISVQNGYSFMVYYT